MTCSKCDNLSTYQLHGSYVLYMASPQMHTTAKLTRQLKQHEFKFQKHAEDTLELQFQAHHAPFLGQVLKACLSNIELVDCRAILMPNAMNQMSIHSTLRYTYSLKQVVGLCLSQWLVDILSKRQLTTFCQPILYKESLKSFGFECLLRAKTEDKFIAATELFEAAEVCDMLFLLDKEARISHIENMNKLDINGHKIFINFNPTSIYDPFFCLNTTNRALQATKINPSQMVFEVIESSQVNDKRHLLDIVNYYRSQGYGVALDDLGSGYSSLNLLAELKPDYVKIDQELVRNIHNHPIKQVMIEKICEMSQKIGIQVICEGIETQEELEKIKTYPIDYYQGYLFAKPMPYEKIKTYLDSDI